MKFKKLYLATAIVVTAGCASNDSADVDTSAQSTSTSDISSELSSRSAELDNREQRLRQLEQELSDRQATISEAAAAQATAAANSAPAGANYGAGDMLPPKAKTGECYARVWVPAKYKTVSEQRLASEQSERVEIIPAKYEWVQERVEVSGESSRVVTTPAVYGTETERVLVSDASRYWKQYYNNKSFRAPSEILAFAKAHGAKGIDSATPGMCFHEHTVPASYSTQQEQVLVSEESFRLESVPATYRTVEKTIVVQEAGTRIVEVPATYKTISEKILVKPAYTTWKKGTGPVQRIDQSTGEIMCLVEVPAQYRTVTKRVIDKPATTKTIQVPQQTKTIKVREQISAASDKRIAIPAKYKTVTRRVQNSDETVVWHEVHNMDHPASTRTGNKICLVEEKAKYKTVTRRVVKTPASSKTISIPAKYKTVKVKKLVSAASEKRIAIPAKYKTVQRQELVSDGFMQWRSILCETNMTRARISSIQSALKAKGYNPGPVDGVIGAQTIEAVNQFQRKQGLPVDKYLNIETVKALGVSTR